MNIYNVLFTTNATRDFKKLPKNIQENIYRVLKDKLSLNPFSKNLNIKKLRIKFPGYRIRIGDYRTLYTVENDAIIIYSIAHRKDAYR